MQLIEGNKLSELCDYSFGDHHVVWDSNLTGTFKPANISNAEFMVLCRKSENKVLTLFIDNIRLYKRDLKFDGPHASTDAYFISYLMQTNDLLELCSQFPNNKFVIFTSHEDTPIADPITIPDNVLGIYGVNALSTNPKVHPFPIGLQRQIGKTDNRLTVMANEIYIENIPGHAQAPSKLLYINCGIERNPERAPLAKFETNSWCTTRFDKDSKFFPYARYNEFLSELRDHKFVACPIGHGMDTHRVWETLYMRRVPVVKDMYMLNLLAQMDLPRVWVENWEDISEENLKQSDVLYQQAQQMDLNKLDLNKIYENI